MQSSILSGCNLKKSIDKAIYRPNYVENTNISTFKIQLLGPLPKRFR